MNFYRLNEKDLLNLNKVDNIKVIENLNLETLDTEYRVVTVTHYKSATTTTELKRGTEKECLAFLDALNNKIGIR